jgi:hypothetical protein
VPLVRLADLFGQWGMPRFLKVDIEGADRVCILSLTRELRPEYVSFEMGDDAVELIEHLARLGYRRFKIIGQTYFLEVANEGRLAHRGALRLMRQLGFWRPRLVRRSGRFFASMHSSGPLPERSDGRWRTLDDVMNAWRRIADTAPSERAGGWYDLHAAL